MSKLGSPYRTPSPTSTHQPRVPNHGGLDAAAFEHEQRRSRGLDADGAARRVALATRQLRVRTSFVLGFASFALTVTRGNDPFVTIAGCAAVGHSAFAMITGTGDSESMDDLPRHLVLGKRLATLLGAGIGLLLFRSS